MERDYFVFYETLCQKLEELRTQRESLLLEVGEYDKYQEQFYDTKNGKQTILVDIGEGCHMQAEVDGKDVRKAFLAIGLDIHVQFDDESALFDFIERRREFLRSKAEFLTSRMSIMQADVEQMRQMLEALAAIS